GRPRAARPTGLRRATLGLRRAPLPLLLSGRAPGHRPGAGVGLVPGPLLRGQGAALAGEAGAALPARARGRLALGGGPPTAPPGVARHQLPTVHLGPCGVSSTTMPACLSWSRTASAV